MQENVYKVQRNIVVNPKSTFGKRVVCGTAVEISIVLNVDKETTGEKMN